ncbi:hypothetical protein [Streptomyces sp. 8N706]|uniref:hypothetical protein n=1 Tax=Streptomyces sp. 8N706 TaxID=3457416 RepID=UPI003FD05738
MSSIRTARALAVVASLPLSAVLFVGGAQADNGPGAGDGSNASTAAVVGSGTGGENSGNSTTTQQVATGSGASNQDNTASANGPGTTSINQSNQDATVNFAPLR